MIKEIKHDLLKFSLIMRHQAHTAAGEKFEDFLEIEHVLSDDDGLAVRCRFKDIVAADLDEASADENQGATDRNIKAFAELIESSGVKLGGRHES